MAGEYITLSAEMQEMMRKDPTLNLDGNADDANGTTPDPTMRYGKMLPEAWIPLYRRPLRTPTRCLRVVTIGAGMAGMNLAYKFQHEHKIDGVNGIVEHTIYEANDQMGGTWYVNKYPGVACDVPAHIYTFPFEPNPDWSAYYATGGEIQEYFLRTVKKYGLDRDVKCSHRVVEARFDTSSGKWKLLVQHHDQIIHDEADILISATGFLSKWRWPNIKGLHDFQGHVCHSASWDTTYDFTDNRIGIIGNGSSAIQILPQLVKVAKHVTNFVRNPTYITAGLGSEIIGGKIQHIYSDEEKRNFREDPEALHQYRKMIQDASNRAFSIFVKNSESQNAAMKATAEGMKAKLGNNEGLASRLIPEWEVGCRRMTPGPGYLEAFTKPNVSLVQSGIKQVERNGILTEDGQLHKFDAIVCATGFDVSHRPHWPLIGRHGLTLADAWVDEPRSYMSVAAAGFPNFFMFSGPNAPVGHGSFMAALGWIGDYITQWVLKIAQEDIKYVDVKPEVVDELDAYADEILQTFVWSGNCQSWYKSHRRNAKITAIWGGSALCFGEMIHRLRPEDFEISYRSRNRFRFMGNGRLAKEYDPNADLAWYLPKQKVFSPREPRSGQNQNHRWWPSQ